MTNSQSKHERSSPPPRCPTRRDIVPLPKAQAAQATGATEQPANGIIALEKPIPPARTKPKELFFGGLKIGTFTRTYTKPKAKTDQVPLSEAATASEQPERPTTPAPELPPKTRRSQTPPPRPRFTKKPSVLFIRPKATPISAIEYAEILHLPQAPPTPALVARFPPSPKPVRVHPQPGPSRTLTFREDIETQLKRIHASISADAFQRWHFSTHKHLTLIDEHFANLGVELSEAEMQFLPKLVDHLLIHCSDVFRYFWAVLTDARPEEHILEPITANCALLRRVLTRFGPQLSACTCEYLLESTLLYLVIYYWGYFAAFPLDKKKMALDCCQTIYHFVKDILLCDFESAPHIEPTLLLSTWIRLFGQYSNPATSPSVHIRNDYTRSVFTVDGYQMPLKSIKRMCANFLEEVLMRVVDALAVQRTAWKYIQLGTLIREIGNIVDIESKSPVARRFLSLLSQQVHIELASNSKSTTANTANTNERMLL